MEPLVSSSSISEKSERLDCCLSASTRRLVVVGPAASLGLVAQEVQVGPPDDMPVPEEYYESEICNQVGKFIMGKEKIREKNFNERKYSLCVCVRV